MGLPEINVTFTSLAQTAITRSEQGIVALILRDDLVTSFDCKIYKFEAEVATTDWSPQNLKYLHLAFLGEPSKVIAVRIGTTATLDTATALLVNKTWNWLAMPAATTDENSQLATWITAQRAAKKTLKAVLANTLANNVGIVNFTTDGLKIGEDAYTTQEFTARIAGLLAGLPLTHSATYWPLAEVTEITDSADPDGDIDSGKFILINDGEKIKCARGINSLTTLLPTQKAEMKKIKIIEGMDLIADDIRTTFVNNYVGVNNSYNNKVLFFSAVNQYLALLTCQGVLYDKYDNYAQLDIVAQTDWLSQHYDITGWTDEQIKTADTADNVFAKADIKFQDAIENLEFIIYI